MTTTIHLRGPADMIAALPYQLGFHPTDSIVLACFRGKALGLVQRLDLPPPDVDPQAVVGLMLPPFLREEADRAILIGYEQQEGDSQPSVDAVRDALAQQGVTVLDRLVVRDGRWYSRDCSGDCCPRDGSPLLPDADVPAVADFVAVGRSPSGSRSELDGQLTPVAGPVMDELTARAGELLDEMSEAWSTGVGVDRMRRVAMLAWKDLLQVDGGGGEDDDDDKAHWGQRVEVEALARMAVSLRDLELRDLLTSWICPKTLDVSVFDPALVRLASCVLPPVHKTTGARTELDLDEMSMSSDWLVSRLIHLCRHTPDEFGAGTLTLLACFTWWLGDGVLTRLALDRALRLDDEYRLAQLLERMVDLAIRPQRSA